MSIYFLSWEMIIGIIILYIIYYFFREKTKQKTNNEDGKIEFLKNKYSKLIGEKDKFKSMGEEYEGEISKIIVKDPYNHKYNWKVYKHIEPKGMLKWVVEGGDNEILIYEISDNELEKEIG